MLWSLVVLIVVGLALRWGLRKPTPAPPPDARYNRALTAFRAKYPDRTAPDRASIEEGRDGSMVVTIVYPWAGIPPKRSFWRIDADRVEELDHQTAARLIDIPVWR